MLNFKYNFVLFGISNDFYRHSFSDLYNLSSVRIREDIFESNNVLLYYLYRIHTFPRIRISFPFTFIWDKISYQSDFDNNKPLCFIFMPKHANRTSYFHFLRTKYPGCKLVMMFRDRYDRNEKWFPKLDLTSLRNNFDLIYSYNKYDCDKYNMLYFNTEASKERLKDIEVTNDVVFVGNVKGRYEKIRVAYEIFQKNGLKTDFYIVGAENEQKFKGPGIIFTSKQMSYAEMLQRTMRSRCILELSQDGEYGFTSRAQEAFMYNKKLITDSRIVCDQRFYPNENIQFFTDVKNINPVFIKSSTKVDYGYNDDYSPIRVLYQINSDLENC